VGEVTSQPRGAVEDAASLHPRWQQVAKRGADLLVAVLGAPIVVAITAVVAVSIAVIDRQSPFYVDRRIGRGGREFGCFKLRTMRSDDSALDLYLAAHPGESKRWAEDRKVGNDPRVTRLGALLRKWSVDELPQFLNVLLGDMSLVGPRPLSQREFAARSNASRRLLAQVRPGITGPWQVAGRSKIANETRIALDDEYAREWSLHGDFVIVVRTPLAIVARTGAQ
jgi:lipopolysaccharide/colanic/teichoic acid biosynthesis glycosyltransferase